ncbi:MAG: response regulator [Sulfurimonas sp.]|nr:response regulator [Sulfurimonas sp.]
MKYLVVDDSKLARKSLIKLLEKNVEDSNIYSATNGQEAIDLMKKEKISIIFLDLTMPIMDGYETLPKLLKINQNAKVVIISADVQVKAREKVIKLGAKLHVKKPIDDEKMEEIIKILG